MNMVRYSALLPKTILGGLTLTLILTCFAPMSFGQGSSYRIGYYGNANMAGYPDSELDIVNPGSTGGYSKTDFKTPIGDLCANIYVFTADQEMVECCSCFVSPNGQIQLSTNLNLTANPLANSSVVPLPHAGDIKIFSSATFPGSDTCSQSTASGGGPASIDMAATTYDPYGALNSWNTHVRQTVGGSSPLFTLSEVPLKDAWWSPDELSKVQAQCYFLQNTGSGHGRCTCGSNPI